MCEHSELGHAKVTCISAALIHGCHVCVRTVLHCKRFIHRMAMSPGIEHRIIES